MEKEEKERRKESTPGGIRKEQLPRKEGRTPIKAVIQELEEESLISGLLRHGMAREDGTTGLDKEHQRGKEDNSRSRGQGSTEEHRRVSLRVHNVAGRTMTSRTASTGLRTDLPPHKQPSDGPDTVHHRAREDPARRGQLSWR
jgi:hypothetical protein